jgi:thioredoxin-like negative regulator of GroEL
METGARLKALLLPRLRGVVLKRAGLALALWGEPGIGKSHCAQQLLRETACGSFSFHALAPLGTLVSRLPRPRRLAAWAEPMLLKLQQGEALDSKRTAETLGALLAALAPVVLHIEDIHEAGPEGLELLQALAATALRTKGVALLVTSRSAPPEPFEEYRLAPLPPEDSQGLLEAEMGSPLPKEALDWVYGRSQGNPLFCLEYLRYLARQGFLWSDGREWHWRPPQTGALPLTVEALLERWLHEVAHTPTLRQTLESKALLGLGANPAVWAKVAGLSAPELNAAGLALQQQGVLRAGEFAHPLYQEVISHGLLPQERREYAQRALEALDDQPLEAARYLEDARLETDEILARLQRAAEAAQQRGDDLQAARLQARAATHAPAPQRCELAVAAAQILKKADQPAAMRLLQLVLQDQPDHLEALYLLAGCHADRGESQEVARLLARIPNDQKTQPEWVKRRIALQFALGDYKGVLELWAAHPALQADPDPVLAYNVSFASTLQGDHTGAEMIARTALDQPNLSLPSRARLLSAWGLSRFYRSELPAALTIFDQAVTAARGAGDPAFTASTLHNRAMVNEELSREAEMLADTKEALRLYAETGLSRHYASTLTKKARILHEMGQYQQSEEAFHQCREILLQSDASSFLITCLVHLSNLYLDWQPSYGATLALKHVEHAVGLAKPFGGRKLFMALHQLSRVETCLGRAAQGLEIAEECQKMAQGFGLKQPQYQALAAKGLALAELGHAEAARTCLQEAYQLASGADWQVYAERIGLELDRLTGNIESARNRLHWFEARGLLNGAQLARRYFPQLDPRPVPGQPQSQALPPGGARSAHSLCEYPSLEVLGPMQLRLEGRSDAVRGQKRKELLAVLLEARISGRNEVPTLELLKRLYPGVPDSEAGTALRQIIFQTRASLGQGLITTTAGGYALGAVESDVEVFLKTQQTRLWRGAYWQDVSLEADETVRGAVYHALRSSIRARLEADPSEAARLGRILLEADPYDLEALRLTCLALRQSENQRGLAQLYQQARGHFLEVGEALPADWASFLKPVAR